MICVRHVCHLHTHTHIRQVPKTPKRMRLLFGRVHGIRMTTTTKNTTGPQAYKRKIERVVFTGARKSIPLTRLLNIFRYALPVCIRYKYV